MSAQSRTKKVNRDKVLPIGLTTAEHLVITEEAAFSGLTPTQIARAAILEHIRERRRKRTNTLRAL